MKLRFYIFVFSITILFLSGCVPTHHLAENQNLLYRIKLRGVEENDPNRIISLYQQRTNRKLMGATPYLSIYYFGRKFYNPKNIEQRLLSKRAEFDRRIQRAGNDSNKIENLLRKREKKVTRITRHLEEGNAIMLIGEPPVIYDSLKAQATLQQIHNFLNSKGYFKHKATFTIETHKKKLTLTYNVQENTPYTYSQVNFNIRDTAIAAIIDSARQESLLKVNQRYDEEVLVNERDRIELMLKNLGYYHFKKQYIVADVDTSFEPLRVRLQVTISNDNDTIPHQMFRLGRVNFKADANLERFGLERDTILFNRIYYLAYNHRISPRIIDKKIAIRPGQRYSLRRTAITNRLLTNLDMFRFLSINYQVDTLNPALLTANINANPSRRFQETTEAGLSYSANLPGPFGNLRLTARNIFGGAELFEVGFRGGLEGQFALNGRRDNNTQRPTSVYTTELGGNMALIFPQFLVPFNANRYFIRYNPRTRINLNYTFIDRQEFTRTNQQTTFDYIWRVSNQLQHVFTPFDLSINSTHNISESFRQRLVSARPEQNPDVPTTYEKSFASSFISSMNYTRVYNTNNYNHTLDAAFTRLFIEESGLLGGLVFRGKDSIPLGEDYLKVFKYYRVNTDFRRYFKLARTTFLVPRFNIGIARAFNKNDYLPYDRYYYAGGGTSVRAFRPRRLGPGSYFPISRDSLGRLEYEADGVTFRRDIQSEQQGELLLEGNLEYRFNLFSFINGALFLDAGNVWMLTKDPARPGSQFEFRDFWREFAVGTGFGFRFDFTFLIARIDLSAKVYDPSLPLGKRFVLDKTAIFKTDNYYNMAFNLGIGYPF